MKALRGLHGMDQRVAVYVPATLNTSEKIDNRAAVDFVAQVLAGTFGGATIQPGSGCWMSEEAGLVKEDTTIVYSYATRTQLRRELPQIRALCERLKKDMQQEAISLEVNKKLYFI